MQPRHALIGGACTALLLAAATEGARGGDSITYKYREDDGTVWYTDRRPNADRHKDFEFLGYHGRPPARSACRGLDEDALRDRVRRVATPLDRYARRYEIDQRLVRAIISVESCFDPKAVSRVGAEGLMQLMPGTAHQLEVPDSFDIDANLRGGVEYFARMKDRFDGKTALALAAYNAGPAAVERHDGIPPYPETRRYVRRVLDRWQALRRGEDISALL